MQTFFDIGYFVYVYVRPKKKSGLHVSENRLETNLIGLVRIYLGYFSASIMAVGPCSMMCSSMYLFQSLNIYILQDLRVKILLLNKQNEH